MNHKERVLKALHSDFPDRVPFFYWDTPEFGEKMMKHLGLKNRDQLLEYLDVDFRWVEPRYIGTQLISEDRTRKRDIWGVGYTRIIEDENQYWKADTHPLEGITNVSFLEEYTWPSVEWFDFTSLDKQLVKYQDYAIMTAPGYSSPGLFRILIKLIGSKTFTEVMMDHPKFFKALCLKVVDFYSNFMEKFFEVAGDRVDFIRIADDFGTKDGVTISSDQWELYVRPAIEVFTKEAKKNKAHFYMHSCGGVRKLLPLFISAGAEVLDPVQTDAIGMSADGLKKDFGKIITFCGAMDEAVLSKQGAAIDVSKGVSDLLDTMAPGGRFILGPSYEITMNTPVENVLAMYDAARNWTYPK